jgi:hypothetical protein
VAASAEAQITILSPTAAPLPSAILVIGDIDFIE